MLLSRSLQVRLFKLIRCEIRNNKYLCLIVVINHIGGNTLNNKLTSKEKTEIAVESGLQLIPFVGGALSTLYFSTQNEKRFLRIESFYEEFAELVKEAQTEIKSLHVDYQPHLISLIERLNDKVERESRQSKREHFKKYLFSILKDQDFSNYDKHLFFLETLDNITELDCEMLTFIHASSPKSLQVGTISKPGINQYAIVGSIQRLKGFGFIKSFTVALSIGDNSDNSLKESIQISTYGSEFIEFCLE